MLNNIISSNRCNTFFDIFVLSIPPLPDPILYLIHKFISSILFVTYRQVTRTRPLTVFAIKAFHVYSICK